MEGRRLKLTVFNISSRCRRNQDWQEPVGRLRLRVPWEATKGGQRDARFRLAPSHSVAVRITGSPRTFRPPLDARLRSIRRVHYQASPGIAPLLKSDGPVWLTGAGRRPWRPAAGQPTGLAGAPVGGGAVALRPASGRVNSAARRRTWPEPRLLKLAIARDPGGSFHGKVAQVGGDRRRREPSFGCALTWGSLRRRTPRSALAFTPKRAPNAGASGAGSTSAQLGPSAAQPRVIRVASSWGVCSGQKDASFVGIGGGVRAVRAPGARRPGTSRAFRGISRSCPGELARRRAVRAIAPGTHSLFHGALDRSPLRRSVQSPQTLVP